MRFNQLNLFIELRQFGLFGFKVLVHAVDFFSYIIDHATISKTVRIEALQCSLAEIGIRITATPLPIPRFVCAKLFKTRVASNVVLLQIGFYTVFRAGFTVLTDIRKFTALRPIFKTD